MTTLVFLLGGLVHIGLITLDEPHLVPVLSINQKRGLGNPRLDIMKQLEDGKVLLNLMGNFADLTRCSRT